MPAPRPSADLALREQRGGFGVRGVEREHAPRDRDRGLPLAERDTVAQQLRRAAASADRVGESAAQRGELGRRHDAAEVEQAVEAERLADGIRGLEREAVGERLAGEADAVIALEQRPERRGRSSSSSASTSSMRGSCSASSSWRERSEKPPLPTLMAVVVPEPLRADVVDFGERGVPRVRD